MIYIGYQVTAVPGKLNELLAAHKQAREIAETKGVSQLGAFQISLGPDAGSLFYLVAYKDAESYVAAEKALAESVAMQQASAWIASASSAVLAPLPGSALQ